MVSSVTSSWSHFVPIFRSVSALEKGDNRSKTDPLSVGSLATKLCAMYTKFLANRRSKFV